MCVGVLPFAVVPLWQDAQPVVMPVWFIAAPPLKLAVDLWQVSQAALVTMCVAGLNNGVTPANAAPLWQVAQPLVMPAWFMVVPAKLAVDLWQVSQLVAVGIWLFGFANPLPPTVWHVAQPVVIPLWFIAAPPLKLAVDLWQVSHAAEVTIWVAGFDLIVAKLPPWQVTQPVVMPVWFIGDGTNATVDLWQVSQLPVVGKCVPAVLPLAVVPLWQVAQPVVMPLWFIAAPPLNDVVDL
jgi:hypothetical protein